MWCEHNSSIIDPELLERREFDIVFEHHYLGPLLPSDKEFIRDFTIERKESFEIAGIDFHYYRNDLYLLGDKYYNGFQLDLKEEPWNEHDPNAIAIYLLGHKLGYIRRDDTDDVWRIMNVYKRYWATLDCTCMGWERINISYLQSYHNTYTLPYQTDVILKTRYIYYGFKDIADFIKGNIGHSVTFFKSTEKNLVTIYTDMNSIMGYINDTFIANQYKKAEVAGFIDDVVIDEKACTFEIKLRFLMDKSVINKNYLNSYETLSKHLNQFSDAGTYSISLEELRKILPRKSSRSISAYDPLVKYLKDYHGITLQIER
jgi:hypothetical protein